MLRRSDGFQTWRELTIGKGQMERDRRDFCSATLLLCINASSRSFTARRRNLFEHIDEERPLRFSQVSSDIFKLDGVFAAAKQGAPGYRR